MFSLASERCTQLITQSAVVTDPFPYMVIDNLLPDDIYHSAVHHRIPDDCLYSLQEMKRVSEDYSSNRRVLKLMPQMFILPRQARQFWEPFASWLQKDLTAALLGAFGPWVKSRLAARPHFAVDMLYVRDSNGYSLGPHTDAKHKILTFLLYLPTPGQPQSMGTTLYRGLDPEFRCPGGAHHEFDQFQEITTVPYRANQSVCFVKTDNSFHGVKPLVDCPERNLIIVDLYYPPHKLK